MNDLAQLSDDLLLTSLKRLTGTSNELTAQLLAHLGEVEARGIIATWPARRSTRTASTIYACPKTKPNAAAARRDSADDFR